LAHVRRGFFEAREYYRGAEWVLARIQQPPEVGL
jgi:hypothetical protein